MAIGLALSLVGLIGFLVVSVMAGATWWLVVVIFLSSIDLPCMLWRFHVVRSRLADGGYQTRLWELPSIGLPVDEKARRYPRALRRRVERLLPPRDEVAVAPAFRGLSDAEMANLALALLAETHRRFEEEIVVR